MINKPDFLHPCLVLGTGFHRWVLGESMAGDFRPLLDWNELLLAVACEMQVPLNRTDHNLALHWEQLLATARHEQGFDRRPDGRPEKPAVNHVEATAKKKAADLLSKLNDTYPSNSQRAVFPLHARWGAVVSLNFDAHWLANHSLSWGPLSKDSPDLCSIRGKGLALRSELLRLNNHVVLPRQNSIVRRLWFPNGFVRYPRSLRLGLREFGFQPVAIHRAFIALKAFERATGSFEQRYGFIRAGLEGGSTLNRFFVEPKLPLTWVTEMLYRPVCFAGTGMSDAEAGLWWLMVQRARNFAGIRPEGRPPAAILVKQDDPRLPFWRTRPCGIEPLICATWDEGWEQVLSWGEQLPIGTTHS